MVFETDFPVHSTAARQMARAKPFMGEIDLVLWEHFFQMLDDQPKIEFAGQRAGSPPSGKRFGNLKG